MVTFGPLKLMESHSVQCAQRRNERNVEEVCAFAKNEDQYHLDELYFLIFLGCVSTCRIMCLACIHWWTLENDHGFAWCAVLAVWAECIYRIWSCKDTPTILDFRLIIVRTWQRGGRVSLLFCASSVSYIRCHYINEVNEKQCSGWIWRVQRMNKCQFNVSMVLFHS